MMSAQPVLTVKSVSAAIKWYEDLLGFKVIFRNETAGKPESVNYAVLRNDDAVLHLGLERDMENVSGQGACNLVTDDFVALYERAREQRVPFYIEMSAIPTGQRTFGIKDPDGNLIAVVERRREGA